MNPSYWVALGVVLGSITTIAGAAYGDWRRKR